MADIADDEAIHRLARREVLANGGDGAGLVDGLGEGEAGGEAFIGWGVGLDHVRFARVALGGERG